MNIYIYIYMYIFLSVLDFLIYVVWLFFFLRRREVVENKSYLAFYGAVQSQSKRTTRGAHIGQTSSPALLPTCGEFQTG